MNWLFISLFCAFCVATADALSKKVLKEKNEYIVLWVRIGFASPFLLCFLPFIEIPTLDNIFFLILIFLVPLETTALILYMKAIKISPLSMTLPFLALSPGFLIVTSNIILGERQHKHGIIGVLLVTLGAYLLNVKMSRQGILQPFKAILRERGSVYMIIVAFIYSITSNLGKLAIQHSSPLFFSATYFPFLSLVLFPLLLWKNNGKIRQPLSSHLAIFILIGLLIVFSTVSHFYAVTLTEVPYFISVKRTSLLFSILYGAILFKEKNIAERLVGGMVMFAGVIVILLF
ncbi:MAG: EamA family transporter [Planctomycetia bacterium]|uniref:EamA family transporter n=1 Tax=Candidatus Kuenenia sp. TaxID=2499824 RepID=UPI001D9D85D5|nr:EamA family transporter [Planctomycetia bacterium]